jgi:ribosome-associated toxin RatA of RatAB toxin-antitoxin module
MPNVNVQVDLNVSIDEVWEKLIILENYPNIMEPVQSITVLKSDGNYAEVEWEALLKGSILKWIEKEVRKPLEYIIEFSQLSGDLEKFSGYWSLESLSSTQTRAKLHIEFEIGIAILKDMLDPVAEKALTENSRKMLLSFGPEI